MSEISTTVSCDLPRCSQCARWLPNAYKSKWDGLGKYRCAYNGMMRGAWDSSWGCKGFSDIQKRIEGGGV